jgi:hypothetical protein
LLKKRALPVNGSTLFTSRPICNQLKGDNIYNQVGAAIEQHDVSADQDVGTFRRRRSETDFQVLRNGLKAFLKAWWKSSTHDELALQSGRQLISLG